MLADNHLAYRGTLSDMCSFLGVATRNSRTNQAIKTAIQNLSNAQLIRTIRDGNTWTLTLSKSAERKSKVIRIKKEWVLAAKGCVGAGVDWTTVLKVWLYLIDNQQEVITSSQIAEALAVSTSAVSRARVVLTNELKAIKSKTVNKQMPDGSYFCLGSNIDVKAWLDE